MSSLLVTTRLITALSRQAWPLKGLPGWSAGQQAAQGGQAHAGSPLYERATRAHHGDFQLVPLDTMLPEDLLLHHLH